MNIDKLATESLVEIYNPSQMAWSQIHDIIMSDQENSTNVSELINTISKEDLGCLEGGNSLLLLAIQKKRSHIAALLIENMTLDQLLLKDPEGNHCLHLAAYHGQLNTVQLLLDIEKNNSYCKAALNSNIMDQEGMRLEIHNFLEHLLEDENTYGNTAVLELFECDLPLHEIKPIADWIIDRMNAHQIIGDKQPALLKKSIINYWDEITNKIIDMCDNEIFGRVNEHNSNFLQEIIRYTYDAVVIRRIANKMDIEKILNRDIDGNTVLHKAVEWERFDIIESILDKCGPEIVSIQNNDQSTAMHVLFEAKSLSNVVYNLSGAEDLIAKLEAANKGSDAPSRSFITNKNVTKTLVAPAKLLIKNMTVADLLKQDCNGDTTAHKAIVRGSVDCFSLIFEKCSEHLSNDFDSIMTKVNKNNETIGALIQKIKSEDTKKAMINAVKVVATAALTDINKK